MKILIVTDVFPPHCGGSGWSPFYLAKALEKEGHQLEIVKPILDQTGVSTREYEGLRITEFGHQLSSIPFVKNYTKNEQFYERFTPFLQEYLKERQIDLLHGQHLMSIPPAIQAARAVGIPSVATVRDYWPRCYWTTFLHGTERCDHCGNFRLAKCLVKREGPAGLLGIPAIPYMRNNVKRKGEALAEANAVIAVSDFVAQRLEPVVSAAKLFVVPNLVDLALLAKLAAPEPEIELPAKFLLFVGKLELNKGPQLLPEALWRTGTELSTIMAGDGPLKAEIAMDAREREVAMRFLPWSENAEILRLMARAQLLLFPATWDEPLSRVLLEAIALGLPVVAMNTGGTADIISDGYNGRLAADPNEFALALAETLYANADVLAGYKINAQKKAAECFAAEVVVKKTLAVYAQAKN